MKTAIIGRGLIGGSLEKAARRAGHETAIFPGRGPRPDLRAFDIVFVATPPAAVAPIVRELGHEGRLAPGACVVDIAGVKTPICRELAGFAAPGGWHFIGGHPMAGKEKTGYGNSCGDLFDGASMILVPFADTPADVLERLRGYFRSLGFARVVETDAANHDRMIAFTSQLCHLVSSAYVREPLAADHAGYSAGSFRDMARVGAPDPDVWTDLFMMNRDALLPVLERYIGRLEAFRDAIASRDAAALRAQLEEGVRAKAEIALRDAAGRDAP